MEDNDTKLFTQEAVMALRKLRSGILLYSALVQLSADCMCVCTCVCMHVYAHTCVHACVCMCVCFPSILSRGATFTSQIRNSNCKILSSMVTTFYPLTLEALEIWLLPQTEWIKPRFSTVTHSGNSRFYLKAVQRLHKRSHVQIMKFSNWDKCAFKIFILIIYFR